MGITKYFETISERYPLLSKEEEKDLLDIYYNSTSEAARSKARDRIIGSNLRYVFKRAKKYAKRNAEQFEDLIAAGNEGLLVGLEKFDPTSGNRFLTYAGWWVMQRMLREMARWRLVALPAQKQQLAARIKRFLDGQETTPTLIELQEAFPNVPARDLQELSQTQYLTFYLDSVTDRETPIVNPIDELIDEWEDQSLGGVINRLPEPKRTVVTMSFGLDDGHEKRPGEIGKHLDLSINAVKQVLQEALEELKEHLGQEYCTRAGRLDTADGCTE